MMAAGLSPDPAPIAAPREQGLQWRDWVLALILATFTFGCAWSPLHLSAIGAPPDEWAHLSYLSEVAVDGRLMPDYAGSRILPAKSRENYLGHPPLYYSALGIIGRATGMGDPVEHFTRYRCLSAVLVAIGVLLWGLTGRLLGVRRDVLVAATAMTCAIPMFPYLAGSVNNDALAYLSVAIAIHGIARVPGWPRAAYYVGALGLACSLLTKLTAGLFLLFLFGFWLVATLRRGDAPLRNRHFQAAAVLLVIACAAYYVPTLMHHHALMPAAGDLYGKLPPPQQPLNVAGVARHFATAMMDSVPHVVSHGSLSPLAGPLAYLLLWTFLLPLVAFAATWRGARYTAAHTLGSIFLLALVPTLLVHFVLVLRNYQAHGVFSGLQPRYYAYAVPGVFLLCLAGIDRSRVARFAFALFALSAALLLSISPARLAQSEAQRIAMQGVEPARLPARGEAETTWPTTTVMGVGQLDSMANKRGAIELSGWAVDGPDRHAARRIWVFLGDKAIGHVTTGYVRPDVARSLGTFAAHASGFRAVIEHPARGTTACDIRLAVEGTGGQLLPLRNAPCQHMQVP